MKRKIVSPELAQLIVTQYMEGYSMCDLSKEHSMTYSSVREILKSSMDCESPCRERQKLWSEKKFLPAKKAQYLDDNGKVKKFNRKVLHSKMLPVALELINNREISHAEIARKFICSREYVGQVAEGIAHFGHDVSRLNATKPHRGSIQ